MLGDPNCFGVCLSTHFYCSGVNRVLMFGRLHRKVQEKG